jgi:hypothetical protein
MSATQANQAEFQDAGKPIANPVYLVDSSGNPTGSVADPLATNQVVGTPVYATATTTTGQALSVTLPAVAGKTTYLNGFYAAVDIAAAVKIFVNVSLDGGTTTHMSFLLASSTSVPGITDPPFPDPIPAKAPNTAIVVTFSATFGATGTGTLTAYGYQL